MLQANIPTTIVDVRSTLSQAATGRIPGAVAVDIKQIERGLNGVRTDGEVIVYCACPNEASAVKVAQKLRQLGFKRVRPLHGGIDAWIEAGLEVENPMISEPSEPEDVVASTTQAERASV